MNLITPIPNKESSHDFSGNNSSTTSKKILVENKYCNLDTSVSSVSSTPMTVSDGFNTPTSAEEIKVQKRLFQTPTPNPPKSNDEEISPYEIFEKDFTPFYCQRNRRYEFTPQKLYEKYSAMKRIQNLEKQTIEIYDESEEEVNFDFSLIPNELGVKKKEIKTIDDQYQTLINSMIIHFQRNEKKKKEEKEKTEEDYSFRDGDFVFFKFYLTFDILLIGNDLFLFGFTGTFYCSHFHDD